MKIKINIRAAIDSESILEKTLLIENSDKETLKSLVETACEHYYALLCQTVQEEIDKYH